MSEHGQKVCFTLCVIITFIAYAVAKKKEAIVEPYWKEITLKEFEEFPSINEGSPTVVEFPSSDGKKKGGSGAATWKTHVGLDCYEGKGGTPILPDPLSSSMSLVECRAACLRDRACEGVVTRTGQNTGYCYKRIYLRLENCVRDSDWTLHEKRAGPNESDQWLRYPGVDCYKGQGGDPIQPDPHSYALSLSECQAACETDTSCEGIITQAGSEAAGLCYKRRNLDLSNCVNDPKWNLLTKAGSGGSGASTPRPPSNNLKCKYGIQAYPPSLPNSHYYTRLCTTQHDLRIISGRRASDAALERTAYLINSVMAYVDPRVARSMTARGFRHAVMAAYPAELTTHIPEHAWLGAYYNERARGLGATVALPVGSSAEENALCHSDDRYRSEDITVHEFAHSMHLLGFALVFPGFNGELTALYNAARSSGSWGSGHYAMTDFKEYFAEGVQSYFDANAPDYNAPVTRDQLRAKDPNLHNFLVKYLGNNPWRRHCRPQRLQS